MRSGHNHYHTTRRDEHNELVFFTDDTHISCLAHSTAVVYTQRTKTEARKLFDGQISDILLRFYIHSPVCVPFFKVRRW